MSLQKGRALPWRCTYHNENRKDCQIVNERRAMSYSPDVPHDFLPCQAYFIFDGRVNKYSERNINAVAYLVGQGQKEVIEEDSGDCNCIILAKVARSQPQID